MPDLLLEPPAQKQKGDKPQMSIGTFPADTLSDIAKPPETPLRVSPDAQKAQRYATFSIPALCHERLSKRTDRLIIALFSHKLLYDNFQLVLQHPADCPFKGSRYDQRKTFHHLKSLLVQLDTCGIRLDSISEAHLQTFWKELRSNARY